MLQHFSLNEQNLFAVRGRTAEAMSTKRKAESHSALATRPRIMKSRGPRVDSERDSGFSGLKGSCLIHSFKTENHQIKAKASFSQMPAQSR